MTTRTVARIAINLSTRYRIPRHLLRWQLTQATHIGRHIRPILTSQLARARHAGSRNPAHDKTHQRIVVRRTALRLRSEGVLGEALSQQLFDAMFVDLDGSLRELGVSDLSVGSYIKRLAGNLYARLAALGDEEPRHAAFRLGHFAGLGFNRHLYLLVAEFVPEALVVRQLPQDVVRDGAADRNLRRRHRGPAGGAGRLWKRQRL